MTNWSLGLHGNTGEKWTGEVWSFSPPFCCKYQPLPDITVHELAVLIPIVARIVAGGWLAHPTREEWEALGDARRHLPEVKAEEAP